MTRKIKSLVGRFFSSFPKSPYIRHHIQKYSDEYLLNYLRELSKKLGRTPTKRDIINECKVSISTYYKHFGNLSNAQKAAGLIPNKR